MGGRRIGILTFWGVPNYGACAQAYALNKLAKSIANKDDTIEHINYLHPAHFNSYYEKNERLYNSFSYSWDIIPHTPKYNSLELETEVFDVIITGSDAIWDFSVGVFGNDTHLIGNNLNTQKLISYAPSFGMMNTNSTYEGWVTDGLKKYDNLSVRDINSKNIVNHLTGGNMAKVVLDPALTWRFDNDNNVVLPKYENYIVVYGRGWTDDFIKNTIKFAREKGLKLISIGFINEWCDMSLKMIELRMLEWIGMIKKAEYVVTNMFHGLMLGLSFHKQIKFEQAPYVKNRSQTLVEELKIPDFSKDYNKELDYSHIDKQLEASRKESMEYLKSSVGEN